MILNHSTFKPAWWLKNTHLQTVYPTFCRRVTLTYPVTRERLTTPDQDFIDIDWCGMGTGPIVLLLHGLAGSSRSPYIQGLQEIISKRGWRSVTLNFRGCSGEYNNTARCYHSGETSDAQFLYDVLRQREPNTPIAVIGFSLGGNVLLKWLGEQGNKLTFFAAVAVSVPLLLASCATKLENGLSQFYNRQLLNELKDYVRQKQTHLQHLKQFEEADKLARLGDLRGIQSFWQYDDQVVAKLYGFNGVQDYYQQASSRQYLKFITVPTLIIQAIDDPFMTPEVLPNANELSHVVDLEITSGGGHVGFIAGNKPWRPVFWLDRRIVDYLGQQLNASTKFSKTSFKEQAVI